MCQDVLVIKSHLQFKHDSIMTKNNLTLFFFIYTDRNDLSFVSFPHLNLC